MNPVTDHDHDPKPEPPTPPEPGDCCHSGCTYCVDDLYQEDLDRYRAALAAWQERNSGVRSIISTRTEP